LLIFASNTAIIGGYHVVLALARLGYFPRFMRRTNALRGTPHVAIAVMTLVPIAVLAAVRGNIDRLGELYGFGLLGAFSLMCIAMDVIRWRERHGEPYVGAEIDPELVTPGGLNGNNGLQGVNGVNGLNGHGAVSAASGSSGGPTSVADVARGSTATASLAHRLRALSAPVTRTAHAANQIAAERWAKTGRLSAALSARPRARLEPYVTQLASKWATLWPHLKFYLGLLTTVLVMIAWLTNLVGKPLATLFGGGLTALGLSVAVAHYRYQTVRYPVVFLDTARRAPGARLVVLTAAKRESKAVIDAAVAEATRHPIVFLYLAAPTPLPPPRLFEIPDRFAHDEEAQALLSRAKRKCTEAGTPARFLYEMGGARQVYEITARVLPGEIMAEAMTAKRITASGAASSARGLAVSPDYVRYHVVDGVRVGSYMLPRFYHDEPRA
jgi:hypothetical protein